MTVRLGTLARLRGRGVVRDAGEPHRTATTLELFFDLTFVVAVAQAAAALDHELAADHVAIGVVGFLGVFAAIWWAWMNYTWFASAHDSGDVPYRLLTLVQMAGALVLGESVLSASVGFQAALDEGGLTAALLVVGIGGLLLAFTAWWIYFDHPGHLTPGPEVAFRCGYAHVVIFTALAATGAGLHVATEAVTGHAEARVAALAVAVPVAAYLLGLVLVRLLTGARVGSVGISSKLVGAAVILLLGALGSVAVAVAGAAAVMVVLATLMVLSPATIPD